MSRGLQTVVCRLRRIVTPSADASDRQLLEEFAYAGRQDAFAGLVRRHGPLVLGVCYRVLRHRQDAEDAFQATFLVLARKARSVAWHDSISNWLHGVAYRIALKARTQGSRRRLVEAQAVLTHGPQSVGLAGDPINWQELRQVLDEELQRLPAKYRAPLLLCYLEGKTRDEAATQLGWSPGSVKGRLERGRDLLRSRLARRGLPLSAVLCATAFAEQGASAAVPAALASATVHAGAQFVAGQAASLSAQVLALTQGVLQAMFLTKVKITTAALLAVAVLGLGTGIAVHQAQAGRGVMSDPVSPFAFAQVDDVALAAQERDDERKRDTPRDGERKEERKKDVPEARGLIKKLDIDKGTITIQSIRDGEGGAERTYNLGGKNIKVSIGERPGKLTDLREGLRVGLQLSGDDDVVAIRAELPTLQVLLRSVDAAKQTVTIQGRERGEETSLKVDAEARLVLDGKASKLADFTAGTRVNLMLSLDKKTVLAMTAGRGEERPPVRRPAEGEGDGRRQAAGVLLGVDAAKGTIEVLSGGEENPSIHTYSLAADAKAYIAMERITSAELKIATLPKATRVRLKMTDDKKVSAIEVLPPVLRVQIKSIDAAKNTLTYAAEKEEKTLELNKDVTIHTASRREAGKLGDLTPGSRVLLMLTPDRSRVLGIVIMPQDRPERD